LVSTKNIRAAQEISLNFESSLRAHELILEKISSQNEQTALLATAEEAQDENGSASSSDTTIIAINSKKEIPTLLGSDTTHIASLIATIKTQIATTTAARALLQETEVKDDSQNHEKILARLAEIKFKSIEIKRIASTTPISSSARASTSLTYIAESDVLVLSAAQKVASSSYSDAILDIQKASQYLIDAETLITAEYSSDPTLKKLIDEALSLPNFSQVNPQITATSTDATASTTIETSTSASSTATSTTGN
jgi:hypothetical protein